MNIRFPLLFVWLFVSFSVHCNSQIQGTADSQILSYIQRAMRFNSAVPQEKVYLHLDNTGYFENETVWFKAYVTRTDRQRASDLSKVLYVELLNPSGDVLKTTKWPIDSLGNANGDMKLDTLFGSGFYEIRAYTRYMTNWGVNACFSRVIPVFKAPKQEGDYKDLAIKTRLYRHRDPNNRMDEDSLYQKSIDEGIYTSDLQKTISVHFYPEGGDLVKGLRSRVAMLAVDDNGKPYQSEGTIVTEAGESVAAVRTDSLGRGEFEIVPDGSALTLQMTNLKGKVQKFPLPSPRKEGCTLTLDAVSEEMTARIECTQGLHGRTIGFATISNGNITYCDTVTATQLIEIELDRDRQKEGVSQLTVFDSMGRVLAERMFFICPKPSAQDSIQITSSTQKLKPCCKVELELKSKPNSSISLSAIDATAMTNGREGCMKTWMLLSSDVKGYISNVDYYFESDDAEHRRSADLLMLTQGWRRYDWELMSGRKTFQKAQPVEDKFYVYGKLNEYRKKNPVSNVNLQAFLYNANGQSLSGETTTDADGNYAFSLPFMDGEWKMQIFTRIDDKRKTFYVGIDRQFSPQARYISPVEASIQHPLAANMFTPQTTNAPDEEEFVPITEKNHVLNNVTVKAKRRYFTNDDWRYKNEGFGRQFATLYYNIDKEREALLDNGDELPDIFQFLYRKNKLFQSKGEKDLPVVMGDMICMDCRGKGTFFATSITDIPGTNVCPTCQGSGSLPIMNDEGGFNLNLNTAQFIRWHGRLSYAGRAIKWYVNNGETSVKKPEGYSSQLLLGSGIERDGDNYCAVTSDTGCEGDCFFPTNLDEIKSVYIVTDSPEETNQAVRIYLYTHTKFTTESQKGLRRTYFQGFNKPETFKMEDYSVIPPMADFRRTIYWAPDIRTDSGGKAKVEFYNNSVCDRMYISAEGMSDDGTVLVNANQ